MKYLYTFLISLTVGVLGFIGAYKFLPLGFLNSPPLVGTTLTSLSSSDTMSDFPTVYNANNVLLNAGKIEISTTTLPLLTTTLALSSVGTITTGTWNATAISVSKGGSGTTSPTLYMTILGNGTAGFTHASSTGTSGQFLTSNGAGAYPSWQTSSVNQSDNYTWTGTHTFAPMSSGGLSPVGSITAYASSSPPTGWLSCNGSAVSRTTYANLFAIIGTTYGVGDNSTTFNIPNLLGKNVLMASSTANMAQSGGESNHTQTWSELAAHTHTAQTLGGNADEQGGGSWAGTITDAYTGTTGTSTPMNVLDPYLTAWYIIKY